MKKTAYFFVFLLNAIPTVPNCCYGSDEIPGAPLNFNFSEQIRCYPHKVPQWDVKKFNEAFNVSAGKTKILNALNIPPEKEFWFNTEYNNLRIVYNDGNSYIFVSKMPLNIQQQLLTIALTSTDWVHRYIQYLIDNGVCENGKEISEDPRCKLKTMWKEY